MISVIMPAYNTEKYIDAAINSVLSQSYSDFELIIINDASTDNTKNCIMKFSFDSRIRLFNNEDNKGVAMTRNIGINLAQGDYISFLDSDDLWDKDFLAILIDYINKNNDVNFVYSIPEKFYMDGRKKTEDHKCVSGKILEFIGKSNEFRAPFDMNSFIIKKKILEKYNIFFPEGFKISEDICFFMKILCVTEGYGINKRLTFYRQHSNSATKKKWIPEEWISTVLIDDEVFPYIEKYYPDAYQIFYNVHNYRVYRFILATVKGEYFDEANNYIKKWEHNLIDYINYTNRLNDKIKAKLILKNKKWLLKIISKI